MPQLYSPHMNGSFFYQRSNADADIPDFRESTPKIEDDILSISQYDMYTGLPLQTPMGANLSPIAASEPSINISCGTPLPPSNLPLFYTPQMSSTRFQNLSDHEHLWSPQASLGNSRGSTTAPHLSFNKPFIAGSNNFEEQRVVHLFGTISSPNDDVFYWPDLNEKRFYETDIQNIKAPLLPCSSDLHTSARVCDFSANKEDSYELDSILKADPFDEDQVSMKWFHEPIDTSTSVHEGDQDDIEISEAIESRDHNQTFLSPKHTIYKKLVSKTQKKLRKAKSVGSNDICKRSLQVSLEDCLHEFHMKEGKFMFEDETALVRRLLRPPRSPILIKKASNFQFASDFKLLKKQKSSYESSLWEGLQSRSKIDRNMESGLRSFQVQLNFANMSNTTDDSPSTESD